MSHVEHSYSDGAAEDELLTLFQQGGSIETVLDGSPSWPLRYHLSPARQNLLSWFPFSAEASLLEVGAGCGALTGLFCERVSSVVALELAQKRADIIAARFPERSNLEVRAGNVMDEQFPHTFDYVTCIGVLEYAERYVSTGAPGLLQRLRELVSPQGSLILAIENRFGLKYWNGAREDHTGRAYDSLEGYPASPGVRTFAREELVNLLADAGFTSTSFYYPMPDYKLPDEVFSDRFLPSAAFPVKASAFPAEDYAGERVIQFNERRVMDGVLEARAFPLFANSFLVVASAEEVS